MISSDAKIRSLKLVDIEKFLTEPTSFTILDESIVYFFDTNKVVLYNGKN